MNKFVILDNVLSKDDLLSIKNIDIVSGTIYWHNFSQNLVLDKLLEIANNYYPCLNSAGYEVWSNNSAVDWHTDIDDTVCKETGVFKYPICSIVYYVEVEILEGGDLVTPDIMLQPILNRMVIFGPGLRHAVKKYKGKRRAVTINPWKVKPEKYLTSSTSNL